MPPVPPDPAPQLALYLNHVCQRCQQLPLGPLDPAGQESARLKLEDIYVGLNVKTPRPVTFDRQPAEAVAVVKAELMQGHGLLLLDGVDEVVPLERRALVWQAIGALRQGVFSGCRWAATCRILSYDEAEAALSGKTGQVTLAALTEPQIDQFVQAWYDTLRNAGEKTPDQARSLARQLSRAARGKLRDLAGNPMLLTIMALVQTNHGTLPEERVKLYKACVEILVLRWQRTKERAGGDLPQSLAEAGLNQAVINPLLYEIGWVAHSDQANRTEAADISEAQVFMLAVKHLKDRKKAAVFVDYTENRAHLLVGRGGQIDRRFSFIHRTFQEYLAACHLISDPFFGYNTAVPLAEAGSPWREVLRFAAEELVYNNLALGRNILPHALQAILPAQPPAPGDVPGWQRVWRAGEMLAIFGLAEAQAHPLGPALLKRLRADLAALLTGGELTPVERAEAGQTLAALGDRRAVTGRPRSS